MDHTALGLKIEELMLATGVPGVAVGVLSGDMRQTVTAGITNQNHPLPITTETLFQIGSITKTMTATVAMRLVEQGKLDLDTPLRHYLPAFQLQDESAAAQATLRHLFTHVGGWVGDYFENTGMGDDALARYVAKMANLPQQAPLGRLWSYNNAGFSLAGHVIEQVTGKPYERVVQEELFTPLGMKMSYFFPGEVMVHRFAVGHIITTDDDGERTTTVATPWPLARSANAAGAVTSTVNDMLDYAQFYLRQGVTQTGEQWLQPATVVAMQDKLAEAGTMASHVGISWMLNQIGDTWTVSHGGATNGQIAQLTLVPARDFAFVILTNANRGREITAQLGKWILAESLGLEEENPASLALTTETLHGYVGYYTAQLSDIDVQLGNDGLLLHVIPKGGFPEKESPAPPTPPAAPAQFIATDRLMISDGPSKGARAEFIRNDDDTLAWLRYGGRVHARQTE